MGDQVSKTKKGIKWSLADQIVRQLLTLLISAVLSRLLTPADYGLLGMVMVATGFLQVFRDVGLGVSIIQKADVTDNEKSTIFWLSSLMGVGLGVILFVLAPLMSDFFSEPRLTLLIRVMSFGFVINGMVAVPDAIIQKAIDFKAYFYRNLGTVLIGGFAGILMAYNGFGVWSLVGQLLITYIAGLLISFRMVLWRPKYHFQIADVRSHLRFSLPLLGDSSLNYWVRNIDSILVGRVLGSVSLGIYSRAYGLMLLPVRQVSGTLARVMFPSFSLIQQDSDRIWDQYCKMGALVATVSFPLMALLGVYAQEVILVIYGSQWLAAVPLFKILCVLGALQSIGALSGTVFYAKGKTLLMFRIGLVSKSLMILGITIGLFYGGLIGMVWGYVLLSGIGFLIETHFVAGVLHRRSREFFRNLLPESIATIVCLFLLLGAKYLLHSADYLSFSFIAFHAISVLVSIVVYFLLLRRMGATGLDILQRNFYEKRRGNITRDAG